ncbi:MAG: hypothetical protein ABEK29_10045, partial [Bradymonadaceae bacterium]
MMDSDAKSALSSTIRDLRERLLSDLHDAIDSRYRMSLRKRDAELPADRERDRTQLEERIDERVRARREEKKEEESEGVQISLLSRSQGEDGVAV